ncbi:MAG: acyl carrier protein [Acidobacteria bacterium]|nr:acyl carrier protein [Acidobacteriota bacterium]
MADDSAALEERVLKVVSESFQIPFKNVNRQTSKLTVGPAWDSFATLNLATALEEALGISFTVDEIAELVSVEAILEVIERKGTA